MKLIPKPNSFRRPYAAHPKRSVSDRECNRQRKQHKPWTSRHLVHSLNVHLQASAEAQRKGTQDYYRRIRNEIHLRFLSSLTTTLLNTHRRSDRELENSTIEVGLRRSKRSPHERSETRDIAGAGSPAYCFAHAGYGGGYRRRRSWHPPPRPSPARGEGAGPPMRGSERRSHQQAWPASTPPGFGAPPTSSVHLA